MKRIKSYSIKKRQETNQKYTYGMPDENNKSGQGGDVGQGLVCYYRDGQVRMEASEGV